MKIMIGIAIGIALTWAVYHFGLQPLLKKLRDDALEKAKDMLGKKVVK
jgi:hypothetical protein